MSREGAVEAYRQFMIELGLDTTNQHLADTPRRVVAMFDELLNGAEPIFTVFENRDRIDQLVVVRDIPFYSMCAHHMLPFWGTVHVCYIPQEHIVGLSKIARSVELFARGLQVQEELTMQIALKLEHELRPLGVGVVIAARHMCMEMRGVKKPGASTVTSTMRGTLLHSPAAREEFLRFIDVSSPL